MKEKRIIPPRFPQKILLRFLRDDLAEEVVGDLDEKFYATLKTRSHFRAKINYWYQVLHYLRPFAIRKSGDSQRTQYAMYRSYFKIGWRNLLKNKTYSFINIGGLAIGLACCIGIGLYIWDEYSYDRFHSRYYNIYRVVAKQQESGDVYNVAVTPGPLAQTLASEFAEVKHSCRIGRVRSNGVLEVKDISVEPEEVLLVDNPFFEVFDFELIKGNKKRALLNPDDVVITESLAAKLFGPQWAQSDTLLGTVINFNDDRLLSLAGIARNPPPNSHIQFDMLLSLRYDELNSGFYGWQSNNYHTYVVLKPEGDGILLNQKILKHLDKYLPESHTTLSLQPLSDIHLHSEFDFQTDWSKTTDIVYVRIFFAVGAVVLFIALCNFVNLSTARAINRAKEVGVRKVIGALRRQLVSQFLSESFIMTSFSIILALFSLQLFLPLLNKMSEKGLGLPYHEPYFLLSVLFFAIVVSFLGGMYPALYLSNFHPAKVLKGFRSLHGGEIFRKVLVIGQFAFSLILVIATIVIYQQLTFLQNKDLGFDQSRLIYVTLKNDLALKASLIKADLLTHSSITGVASTSNNLIDVNRSTGGVTWDGKEEGDRILLTHMNVDPNFLSTTGMSLVTGRNFNPLISSDTSSAFLINETAARRMGWNPSEALGKTIELWQNKGQVIGVVKDFHFRPLTSAIEPFLFFNWPREPLSGMFVKAKGGNVPDAISALAMIYKKYDAKSSLHYEFMDDGLQRQYLREQNTGHIVLTFSVLAIFVSCLGLFGLATYSAERRIKEIGVRKVLGASVASIVRLLSVDFVKLVIIAILIASPIAWWCSKRWLQDFAYKIDLRLWMFIISGAAAISIALLTVSFQSIKAALMNPTKNLRTE